MFPTADQIATALVTACRLTGDNPVTTALGQQSRGRQVAFAALAAAFPEARRLSLARCVGYLKRESCSAAVSMARKQRWWNENWVDETVGALVAEQYGERAA